MPEFISTPSLWRWPIKTVPSLAELCGIDGVQSVPDGLLSTIQDYLDRLPLEEELLPSWKQFVFCAYQARIALLNGNCAVSHQWLLQGMQEWLTIFDGSSNAWITPTMKTIALNIVDVAFLADNENEETDPHRHCTATGSVLQDAFAAVCRGTKKSSGLAVSNALSKLYFKLDELEMAVVFQTRVDSQLTLPFEAFPASDRATWKYFNGLVVLERLKFREAEECLTYALEYQLESSIHNIRKILILLIPLRLLFNEIPKRVTLDQFGVPFFSPLIEAFAHSQIREFFDFINRHEASLVNLRIWALLQKLPMIMYRNVLLKCYKYHSKENPGPQSHHLDLRVFEAGLRISDHASITIEDTLSIARTLIQKDYVCGYIATQRKLLVLAKDHPFPKLRDINPENGEIFVELD